MELKKLVWVSLAWAGLSPCASWAAGESAAASAPQSGASLNYFTPNFYPSENAWLVTGSLSQGNSSIQSVTRILGRPDSTQNLSEHSTLAASSLRYGLSSQSEVLVSVSYLAASTLYPTSWTMPQLAYAYRITPPDSALKSNLTATYIPKSLFDGPFSGPARFKLGGVSSYEVAPESWVSMGLEYRFKSSEKFPGLVQLTGGFTRVFSTLVVSAGLSAKKQDSARPNPGSRLDNQWTPGVNLGLAQKIDAKRGFTLVISQERQKTNEVMDSGFGSLGMKIRTSAATLGYYQAF
jgi:hypothetical protein